MRSRAWSWDFSSTHNTIALSGGLKSSPTMSRTLTSSSGSVENLNVPDRCGWMPNHSQSLEMLACDTRVPWRRNHVANRRLDQCVIPSSDGGSINVAAKISSRTDSSIVGGLPERGWSTSPARPWRTETATGSPSARYTPTRSRPGASSVYWNRRRPWRTTPTMTSRPMQSPLGRPPAAHEPNERPVRRPGRLIPVTRAVVSKRIAGVNGMTWASLR